MKRMSIAVVLIMILSGCAMLQGAPSVCDTLEERSLLCETAAKAGIRLEDLGNGLIIANMIAIAENLYTRDQAAEVLTHLRDLLHNPISYLLFANEVQKIGRQYPGLLAVAEIYMDQLLVSIPIHNVDRALLVGWLDKQIEGLS